MPKIKKPDMNAALRHLRKCLSGSDELYIFEGMAAAVLHTRLNKSAAGECAKKLLDRVSYKLDADTFIDGVEKLQRENGAAFTYAELCEIPLWTAAFCIHKTASYDLTENGGEGFERLVAVCSSSLRFLGEFDTDTLISHVSAAEAELMKDPVCAASDDATKRYCRGKISETAKKFGLSEAEAAKKFADKLFDPEKRGVPVFYLSLMYGLTLIFSAASYFLSGGKILPALLLLFPFSELSRQICDSIFSRFSRGVFVPRLKLDGVPDNAKTLTVITSLLDGSGDGELLTKLENAYLCQPDKNVIYGILGDLRDSKEPSENSDEENIRSCREGIDALNRKYGDVFRLFVRRRRWSSSERTYMAWERKRGAVLELTRLICGEETSFYGQEELRGFVSGIRYLVTLDSDTVLYRGALSDMLSAMLHPANRPIIRDGRVVAGYAIMQPRMETSLKSAASTPFTVMKCGAGGSDIYADAAYDTAQSVFGRGIFCGKGIIDVGVYHTLLNDILPEDKILSHDLPEGEFLRTAALGSVALEDSMPRNPVSYLKRSHRWTRGDVQSLIFTGRYILTDSGEKLRNPLPPLSKYRIYDNIRRSLTPILAVAALACALFYPTAGALVTTALALSYLLFPFVFSLFSLIRDLRRRFFSRVLPGVFHSLRDLIYEVSALFQNAYNNLDAILRALWRMYVSGRRRLEWVTASDAERKTGGAALYILKLLPSLIAGVLLIIFAPLGFKLLGIMWALLPFVSVRLGRPYPERRKFPVRFTSVLTRYAADTWRYFENYALPSENRLPPDNVQFLPAESIAHRTSPTNIGLYFLSCLAACDFGFITPAQLYNRLDAALDSVESMAKWHGHLYNWYDTQTLDVIGTPYVSTVDSGNFIVSLIALKEGLPEYAGREERLGELLPRINSLICGCDFRVLYNEKRKLFSIGADTVSGTLSAPCYDIFMSEARTVSYYAVATGTVGREHWRALSRIPISDDGYIGLASWTGTMFEFFMPALLTPVYYGSLSYEALSFALHEQIKYGAHGIWGISESAYFRFDGAMNYQYRAFGVQSLGLKRGLDCDRVISPYSSFLTLCIAHHRPMDNLARLKKEGMYGPCGFYEALDMTHSRVGEGSAVIRSYMAHHQGMSLIAAANACFDGIFVKRFMRDPYMRASAGLLCDKIPVGVRIVKNHTARADRARPETRDEFYDKNSKSVSETVAAPELPFCVAVSNGMTQVIAGNGGDVLLRDGKRDICADPFYEGHLRSLHLFCDINGKVFDLLSGCLTDSVSHVSYTLQAGTLRAETVFSVHGDYRCFCIGIRLDGMAGSVCPLLCFEPTLLPGIDRRAHPAFTGLSLESFYSGTDGILFYRRRPRSERNGEAWLAVAFSSPGGEIDFCVSRSAVLGMKYGMSELAELTKKNLGSRDGACIDPFCAIKRRSATKNGHYRGDIIITTGKSRAETESVIHAVRALKKSGKWGLIGIFASSLALTLDERLAASGASGDRRFTELLVTAFFREVNRTPPPCTPSDVGTLWGCGISGDLPIAVLDLRCGAEPGENVWKLVYGFLAAHRFLRFSGVQSDIALLYENGGYESRVRDRIERLLRRSSCPEDPRSGGVYLLGSPPDPSFLIAYSRLYIKLTKESSLPLLCAKYLMPQQEKKQPIRSGQARPVLPERKEGLLWKVAGGAFYTDGFMCYKKDIAAPWSYVYASAQFGTLITVNSLGYTWYSNSHERRITPYDGDSLLDFSGEQLILSSGGEEYDLCACSERVFFGRGCAVYEGFAGGVGYRVYVGADKKLPVKAVRAELSCPSAVDYRITPAMGEKKALPNMLKYDRDGNTLFFSNESSASMSSFRGFLTRLDDEEGVTFLLGAFPERVSGGKRPYAGESSALMRHIIADYSSPERVKAAFGEYAAYHSDMFPSFNSGIIPLDVMMDWYLPYQVYCIRYRARTGFYQSGGAYGFRDQLQDCTAILRFSPKTVRTQIFRCAAHQYIEGDVMHWWHSLSGISKGVRTRISDDLLWLPYTVARYVDSTGDMDILDTILPYLSSAPLEPGEYDRYEQPLKSRYRESLYMHCVRAIEHGLSFGEHGLPLMGGGDWNDGMNAIGADGKGESVWLGFFLVTLLDSFIPICEAKGDRDGADKYRGVLFKLREALEKHTWDGEWYLRAFYGDSTPLGSSDCRECRIDLLPQAFAAFSGAEPERVKTALDSAYRYLWDPHNKLFKLFTPPFDLGSGHDPGYIRSYVPGVRENGGQYTHAAVWGAMALDYIGEKERASEILMGMNPAARCADPESASVYRLEPYFLAGDVYSNPPGRGGWSLYTGAAGWYYQAIWSLYGRNENGKSGISADGSRNGSGI